MTGVQTCALPIFRPHYVGDDADASVIANEEVAVIEENNDQIIGDEDNDDVVLT